MYCDITYIPNSLLHNAQLVSSIIIYYLQIYTFI